MIESDDPLTAYANAALPTLSELLRRELQQGQRLADLVGLVSDGTGPTAAMGRQSAVLHRRDVGELLAKWKVAMRSEAGARKLDDPGPGRLAVLVTCQRKGGLVFYCYDPTRQTLTNDLLLTPTVDNALAVRLIQAVDERNLPTVRDLARAAATIVQIAATTWARLCLSEDTFVDLAGQSYDHMKAAAEAELAQGRDPWRLAGIPDRPEGAGGISIPVELDYDRGVWSRVTDALMEGASGLSDPNEVATLLTVAARFWVLCRFDKNAFANVVARREHSHAIEEVAAVQSVGQGDRPRPGVAPS